MRLSDHDLSQLTEEELLELPEAVLRRLSVKLLTDLKEARERLKQNSRNSSRPPSSDKPWDNAAEQADPETHRRDNPAPIEESIDTDKAIPPVNNETDPQESVKPDQAKRKPGKQPGAAGYGRTQKITVTSEEFHYPFVCARCDRELNTTSATLPAGARAYTAFETVDLVWANPENPGIQLTNTKHIYYEIDCLCGHCTQQAPYRQLSHPLTPEITLGEWRLVGPGLAALIVCLAYRMRLSRPRIQEFLDDWLGLELSVGTLNATLHESGAAALPVEDELVEAVQNSGLLNIDETSWPEWHAHLWLWVFCGQGVVAYWIATRGSELLANVLGNAFQGWLMSDGWCVYRQYRQRLRCWAHLLRKAVGLEESLDPTARAFGLRTRALLNRLVEAVYAARIVPPEIPLTEAYHPILTDYRTLCETMSTAVHEKTCQLAKEMLNDWEAIFLVLAYPHLPLTNNEAERALRHWVMLRGMCHGTRTEDGTRIFAILISIIETCRVRQQSPWLYLATLIRQRRAGFAAPKLPVALNH